MKSQIITQDNNEQNISLLEKMLINMSPGQLISYKEMSSLIGKDVQSNGYSVLYRARIRAEKQGFIFGTVTNEGLKRLCDTEISKTADKTFSRIRHISKNGNRKLSGIQDLSALPSSERSRVIAQKSILNIISLSATERTVNKLIPACQTRLDYLPTLEVLASLEG